KYYYTPALWAYEAGIEKGSGGKFRPNTDCTRASTVLYLYRFYTGRDLL
ncbi:MAG: S-layer homology domain-containing protein, partial [Oscillospiraceae bacterium]|nr:S-layer homology domain-containing protein [Oscillospiraceae bacterium]